MIFIGFMIVPPDCALTNESVCVDKEISHMWSVTSAHSEFIYIKRSNWTHLIRSTAAHISFLANISFLSTAMDTSCVAP